MASVYEHFDNPSYVATILISKIGYIHSYSFTINKYNDHGFTYDMFIKVQREVTQIQHDIFVNIFNNDLNQVHCSSSSNKIFSTYV